MTDLKIGDRVRYTDARDNGNGIWAKYIGIVGTVTSEPEHAGIGMHVHVDWDNKSQTFLGFPYVENLELVEAAPEAPNFATEEELFGILSLVKAFNDTLTGGNINGSVSVGNTALYDSNGEVLGYIAYNSAVARWVFYDPSFKNEV